MFDETVIIEQNLNHAILCSEQLMQCEIERNKKKVFFLRNKLFNIEIERMRFSFQDSFLPQVLFG